MSATNILVASVAALVVIDTIALGLVVNSTTHLARALLQLALRIRTASSRPKEASVAWLPCRALVWADKNGSGVVRCALPVDHHGQHGVLTEDIGRMGFTKPPF